MSQPVTTVALTVLAGGAAWWLTKVSADEPKEKKGRAKAKDADAPSSSQAPEKPTDRPE